LTGDAVQSFTNVSCKIYTFRNTPSSINILNLRGEWWHLEALVPGKFTSIGVKVEVPENYRTKMMK
jgi:hypothetical protein